MYCELYEYTYTYNGYSAASTRHSGMIFVQTINGAQFDTIYNLPISNKCLQIEVVQLI